MEIELFFGTNRNVIKRNSDQQPVDFGTELNDQKPLLHFGKAIFSDNCEDLKEVITSTDVISEDLCCSQNIFDEIEERMRRGIDTIVLFHGFCNTFTSALKGAAELKCLYELESQREHTMIVFSWPSDGNLLAYDSDRSDAHASGRILGAGLYKMGLFLLELCFLQNNRKRSSDTGKNINSKKENNISPCGRLHIMAHSMGNYVLRWVLQELRQITGEKLSQLFDEILLIAADEDKNSFERDNKLKHLPEIARRVSVYFNKEDFPLKLSDWLMGHSERLGSTGPGEPHDIPAEVSLINCRNVATGLMEHDYHKTDQPVRRDILYVLNGWKSEDIPGRVYSPETNSYYLTDNELKGLFDRP